MNETASLLLDARPLAAIDRATELLAVDENASIRADLVRALVGVVRVDEARVAGTRLPDENVVARAWLALAEGQPGRGRLLLSTQPSDELLHLDTFAELTRASGDAAMAVQIAGKAHTIAAVSDPRWPAFTGLTLGRCLGDAGDPALAERVLEEALAAFEADRPETVGVAETLDTLAAVARRREQPARAVILHRRAASIWTACLGADCAPLAGNTYGLAQALHRTGAFQDALEAMQSAFVATVESLGTDHLDTWITRFELGRMEVDAGEIFDGFPRMESARAEVARRLGSQHPVVRMMDRHL